MFIDDLHQMLEPLTGPGGECEIAEAEVGKQRLKVFKNAAPTLRDFYQRNCQTFSDDVFLIYQDERYSFAETHANASALASQLVTKYGIQKGDRVAIAMRNYPEWCFLYMAITSIGAVVVPMNAWWVTRELAYGLQDSGAKLLFVDQQRLERVQPLLEKMDIACAAARVADLPAGIANVTDLIAAGAGASMPAVSMEPDDSISIMYTSGTTGFPKGAEASHRSIINAVGCLEFMSAASKLLDPEAAKILAAAPPPGVLLTVPLFHVTGSHAIFLLSFPIGRKIQMMHKWDAATAMQLIERERITYFTGVPTMVWEMMQHPEFDNYDLSSLANIGGGGAPAPAAQVQQVTERFQGQPGMGYGLTETNAMGALNSGAMYVARPTSTGIPVILADIKIVAKDGQALLPNASGEICISGAMLVKGYWNNAEATAESFRDGWFFTGDLGHLDEDGFLYIEDRAKDMILRGGENVYCAEVEAAIYELPNVYECSVFGVPDERLGEEVACVVMPKQGTMIAEAELRQHLLESLAKFKCPAFIRFTDEQLPRNAAGKILKHQLREEAAKNLGPPSP